MDPDNIKNPTTLAQAIFNLPTGNKDKRLLTVSEMETRKASEKWEVTVFELALLFEDLPEHYQIAIYRH